MCEDPADRYRFYRGPPSGTTSDRLTARIDRDEISIISGTLGNRPGRAPGEAAPGVPAAGRLTAPERGPR